MLIDFTGHCISSVRVNIVDLFYNLFDCISTSCPSLRQVACHNLKTKEVDEILVLRLLFL